MAIVNNRSSDQGDVLVIKPDIPRVGILSLFNFSDDISGEDTSNYFEREFRYSINGGIIFTQWIKLTNNNLLNIIVEKQDSFVIELRYIRIGNEGELGFNNVKINGKYEDFEYPVYDKTPFKTFFELRDINVFRWSLNVLEKLYREGILAKYVERGESDNINADKDFIALFNTITDLFAVLVNYSRQFQSILNKETLLTEFIKNKGLYTNPATGVEGFVELAENISQEFKKRGTRLIYKKSETEDELDGELLRLICYSDLDEFLFALTQRGEVGWCIGKSSPCYSGTNSIMNLNKSYEYTEDIFDLSKYPLVNSSNISLEQKSIEDKYTINEPDIELIKNGDFSQILQDWAATNGVEIELESIDGKLGMKVKDLGFLYAMAYQEIDNNGRWDVSFKAMAGTIDAIEVYNCNDSQMVNLEDTWGSYTISFSSSFSSSSSIQVKEPIQLTNGDGYFFITDVSIKKRLRHYNMMKLLANNIVTGIGDITNTKKAIVIDNKLNYEISFKIIANDLTEDLSFGVYAYGALGNPITLLSAKDDNETSLFFENIKMNVVNNCYLIRGIIYNSNSVANINDSLTLNKGNNLRFKNSIYKIMPFIHCTNSVKFIYDLQIKPLTLPISQGVMGGRNFTYSYIKNNSDYLDKQIEKNINKELIPYNQFLNIKFL